MLKDEFPFNLAYDIFQDVEESKIVTDAGISKALSTLTIGQQKIIHKRYFERLSLSECAKEYGINKDRVRRIQLKALKKLRQQHIKDMIKAVSLMELGESQLKQKIDETLTDCGISVQAEKSTNSNRAEDLTGKQFGDLLVLNRTENSTNRKAQWLCKCKCGAETIVRSDHLKSGATKSCGCDKNIKHGLSKTRLYYIWNGMRQRCNSPQHKDYPNYGAKGISVCEAWRNDFMAFREWALSNGYADNLTIDRIDGNGNYEPSNCRWVSSQKQAINRRSTILIEYKGKEISLSDLASELNLPKTTVFRKFNNGETVEDIISYAESKAGNSKESGDIHG